MINGETNERRKTPLLTADDAAEFFRQYCQSARGHRALADAEMAASLLLRLTDELRTRHQLPGVSHAVLRSIQATPKPQLERCLARHRQAAA